MDKITINTYNKLAQKYDEETIDFWKNFPSSFIDKFARLTQGKVLNVGSGPGRDAELLKARGLDVVCLDASEAMVKMTNAKGFDILYFDTYQPASKVYLNFLIRKL